MPGTANAVKVHRQPTRLITQTTNSGVIAPPHRLQSHMILTARLRSTAGSHLVKALARLGKAPDSAPPKKNCAVRREARFQARPVAAVKRDHMATIRVSTLRGP